MSISAAPKSKAIALEVYALLRELDPNHWCGAVEVRISDQVAPIIDQLQVLTAEGRPINAGPALDGIYTRMVDLAHTLEHLAPPPDQPEMWEPFRVGMVPAYEHFAASLGHIDVHVPSLRPTNYARNLYHIANAVFAVLCLRFLSEGTVLMLASSAFVLAWACEIGRRVMPKLNDFLMQLMRKVAHPHEAWRINSATWYVTACVILSLIWNPQVASVGLVVLGFADPAAAIIGRRYGRHQLVNGRTLEGTLAFIAVGTVMAWFWLLLGWGLAPGFAFKMAAVGATVGGIAELYSRRIDDNLSVPVAAAVGALAVMGWG